MTTFKERVKQIKSAEKDVDKVLKAAKLQRTPRQMDWEYLFAIIITGMFFAFFLLVILVIGGR